MYSCIYTTTTTTTRRSCSTKSVNSSIPSTFKSHNQFPFSPISTNSSQLSQFPILRSPLHRNQIGLLGSPPHASIPRQIEGTYDPELHSVLQLATGSELYEIQQILYGPSYFSPLFKSITKPADIDYVMIEEDPEEREDFIALLESRFFFLAADARSTLRGWRPSYRNVLLGVRKKLNVPCSTKLATEDLEVEIFLHLLQDFSSEEARRVSSPETSDGYGSLEVGLNQQKVQAVSAFRVGALKLRSMILKSGGIFTLGKLYELLARGLSGRMFLEAANYQITKEVIKKGGHLAATNLESRVALLAAKKGVGAAASRYIGLRSVMQLFGPLLWGTLLADVVIQMLGTDYARILRAIYAIAQIRIQRTYKLSSDIS